MYDRLCGILFDVSWTTRFYYTAVVVGVFVVGVQAIRGSGEYVDEEAVHNEDPESRRRQLYVFCCDQRPRAAKDRLSAYFQLVFSPFFSLYSIAVRACYDETNVDGKSSFTHHL